MKSPRWHGPPLIVPARTLTGAATQVAFGLIEVDDGLVRAVRIGSDTAPVILPRQALVELISHAQLLLTKDGPDDRSQLRP